MSTRFTPHPALGALLHLGWRQTMSEKLALTGRALTFAMLVSIFANLWRMTPFAESTDGMIDYASMVWYFMTTEVAIFSGGFLYKEVQNDIRTGQLTGQLCRPFSYQNLKLAEWFGRYMAQLSMLLPVGVVLAWALTGEVVWPVHLWPVVLLSLALSGLIIIHTHFVLGVVNLWTGASEPIYIIWQKGVFLLGGLMLPLLFYPQLLQDAAWFTPFPAILTVPASFAFADAGYDAVSGLVHQVFWVAVSWAAAQYAFARVLAHIGMKGD